MKLKFEPHNFRVDSTGWKKRKINGKKYLVNPKGDIWELIGGKESGEQLFTWRAAMRETKKAGKRMPTNEEFSLLWKTKSDMPNLVLTGLRVTNGAFHLRGTHAYFGSSSERGTNAWYRYLFSGSSTVYRSTSDKAYGFSVRCVQNG